MTPPEPQRRMPLAYAFLTVTTVIACLASYVTLIIFDVQSVLVTGPVLLVLGIILLVWAAKQDHHGGVRLGYFIIVSLICLLLLTWIADWKPSDARAPLLALGAIFVIATFVLSNRSFAQAPKRYKAWQCQQCGYPLYGLQSAKCPECGRDLDTQLIAKYAHQEPTQT